MVRDITGSAEVKLVMFCVLFSGSRLWRSILSVNDVVADGLTRIRNAQSSRLRIVRLIYSGLMADVLAVLRSEGYILDFKELDVRKGVKVLEVGLKYYSGEPVIKEVRRISKPGRRVYWGLDSMKKFYGGLGIFVLSTSRGVMSDRGASRVSVGGEVLCGVF